MAAMQTIDAIWAKRASERLTAAGLAAEEILNRAGIKPNLLNYKSARIPFRKHAELLNLAAEATGNDCFALDLAAKEIDPRDNGLLAYAALSSKTLSDALKLLARYLHVLNEAAEVVAATSLKGVIIEFHISEPGASNLSQATEFGLANFIRGVRFLTGTALRPIKVDFAHLREQGVRKFEKFFSCPVRFGGRRNAVVFSDKQLALPIATADERLLAILSDYCEEILTKRADASPNLRCRVEKTITRLLPSGEAGAQTVARELGMSGRTLSRRLNESGLTFVQILDELRRDLALKYLEDPTLALSQVTLLLGYSEVSGFNHAFKRWTGGAPGDWRARNMSSSGVT